MATATQTLRVGDKGIFEFELVTVDRVSKDGTINGVNDGSFSTGGRNLMVFPRTPKGEEVAAFFHAHKERIRASEGSMNLNWPDLQRYIVGLFEICMNNIDDPKMEMRDMQDARVFFSELMAEISSLKQKSVRGVRLFR
jgi:hypothetical protein